jgi:hypothetical protein
MQPAVIFLHIPKAGGMTFETIVRRQFAADEQLHTIDRDLDAFEARWKALSDAERARIRCVHGHIPYGVHTLLPRPAVYVTLLRDPVERFLSSYYYALRRPEGKLHTIIVQGGLSLEDFIAAPEASHLHDLQVRYFAGRRAPGEPEDDLERAKRHLEGFAVAGLVERFDESVLHAGRVLGWRNVLYAKTNVNKWRPPAESPAVRAAIAERNARDLELYRWAAERFAAVLAERPIAPAHLLAFSIANRAYSFGTRVLRLPQALVADARAARRRREVARGRS